MSEQFKISTKCRICRKSYAVIAKIEEHNTVTLNNLETIKKNTVENNANLLKELETLDSKIFSSEKLLHNKQSTRNGSKENNETLNSEFNITDRNNQEPATLMIND